MRIANVQGQNKPVFPVGNEHFGEITHILAIAFEPI